MTNYDKINSQSDRKQDKKERTWKNNFLNKKRKRTVWRVKQYDSKFPTKTSGNKFFYPIVWQ